ncbi:MAG TPA: 50S ribosomal protein L29 [Polyangiaceae bacterium]|nr:50S ribosomal protein L29 [Polyangiaceae bacterium]
MKAKDLRERTDADLVELGKQLERDLFSARMKNHTGQLDDTSQLTKLRRDLARIAQIRGLRAKSQKASGEAAGSEK